MSKVTKGPGMQQLILLRILLRSMPQAQQREVPTPSPAVEVGVPRVASALLSER